jgi:hypothetical protein
MAEYVVYGVMLAGPCLSGFRTYRQGAEAIYSLELSIHITKLQDII